MSEWTRTPRVYPSGTPVYIFRAYGPGKTGPRERGVLLTCYATCADGNEHPVLRTDSGDTLEGCECWWIPIEAAESSGTPLSSED